MHVARTKGCGPSYETTRENKIEKEHAEGRMRGGSWENIFALSSRARSYYWHTWCNILPLIFASVRGFLLRPWRDFTSTHTVRDATGGSSPGRHKRVGNGGWARMIECYRSSWRVATMRHPSRFDSSRDEVPRSREVREGRRGVAGALIAQLSSLGSSLSSTCFTLPLLAGYRPSVSHNNGFRTQRRLLFPTQPTLPRCAESACLCRASDTPGTCLDLEAKIVVIVRWDP